MRAARTAAAVWRERVDGLAASGKGLKAYAAELGVNPHTLAGWRWKLRKRAAAELAKPMSNSTSTSTMERASGDFVEVTREVAAALAGEVGVIEIELCDARIRIRGRVESDALAGVLRAVEGRR